jgi:menaquinol-cytochrome c reductase iron-sulfur subunit
MKNSPQPNSCGTDEGRRQFLAGTAAAVCGAAAIGVPTVTGIVTFLDPLARKSQGGEFVQLAALDAIPTDGSPLKVSVVADRTDAWSRFPRESIGAVFLSRTGDKPDAKLRALQVICPHAGCSIGYDAAGQKYFCPCHSASFDMTGARTDATSPSPRNMDALDVEIRNKNEVWVKFRTFVVGTAKKTPQA